MTCLMNFLKDASIRADISTSCYNKKMSNGIYLKYTCTTLKHSSYVRIIIFYYITRRWLYIDGFSFFFISGENCVSPQIFKSRNFILILFPLFSLYKYSGNFISCPFLNYSTKILFYVICGRWDFFIALLEGSVETVHSWKKILHFLRLFFQIY